MSSNLACIGLDVTGGDELQRIARAALERASVLGERAGRRVLRWQDDDGARLVLVVGSKGALEAMTPSYAAEPGADLGDLTHLNDECWSAAVLQDGEQVTAFAADLERSALVEAGTAGRAAVTALGSDVQVFADAAAFEASNASLLTPDAAEHSEPPAEYLEKGWRWPPRMGVESFISHGVFAPAEHATAHARLNGVVLRSRTCRNSLTGTAFHVARVRTVGFEADVCLAVDEHTEAPLPGAVVAGTVYLVVALDLPSAPEGTSRRRRGLRLPWAR